jgi:ribosylpyrimidine nucleosidase
MIGLDVTRKVLVLPEIISRMEKINSKASVLFTKLMKVFNENQNKVFGLAGGPLHDPVTIAYLLDPSILELKPVHCDIDISHGSSYGRTNCDIFDYMHLEKNTYLAMDISTSKFWDIVEEGLKR